MYEYICYEKHFLKEVIARIDFVVPIEALEKTLPPKLEKVLSEDFPISEPVDAISQELQVSDKGLLQHRQKQFKQWNFFGKEREKQISLAAPFVFFTYPKYTTFENMRNQFAKVIDGIKKTFPDARARRFGLRYINNIEIENLSTPISWGEYISASLLETTSFFTDVKHLIRLIQIAEIKEEELSVKFQFGMPNPDYPARMKRPQFVLDLDGYVQMSHDLDESLQYMVQAHKKIQELFEKSITSKLRERMNVRPTEPIQE